MADIGQEPDFSIGTRLKRDPDKFKECVLDAFRFEYGFTKQGQIASHFGHSPGWISDVLNYPSHLESEAIANLIAPIKSERFRRRILRTWIQERFAIDILEQRNPPFNIVNPTEKTVERIWGQISEGHLFLAAHFALRAYSQAKTRPIQEKLLDLALLARQRSALYGQAMQVAKLIEASGRVYEDPWREAQGIWARAQTLLTIPNSKPDEIEPLTALIERKLRYAGAPPAASPFAILTREQLDRLRISSTIVFMERGTKVVDQGLLRETICILEPFTKISPKRRRFPYHHLLARCYALLSEYFLAQEHLEQAYRCARGKVMHAKEICGVVQGRIMDEIESPEIARDYLWGVSRNALRRWDLYHLQTVESDLARLESRFPESFLIREMAKVAEP